jgi:predicted methyltransferase
VSTPALPLLVAAAALALAACGSSTPPPAPPGIPQNPPMRDPMLDMMTGDAPSAGAATPSGPNADAKTADAKKAEEAKKLEADFAKLAADIAKEKARFTPDLEAKTKSLAEKDHGNVEKALREILGSEHRAPGASDRDKWRHPVETLLFFGIKPDSKVLEFGGGGGWYTEVLSPLVAKKGKLAVSGPDPNGPRTERRTLYGQRIRAFLDKSPSLGGKVQFIAVGEKPALGPEGQFDLVVAIREIHGWQRNGVFEHNVAEVMRVLKPGGVFGVVAHRAKPDADVKASVEKGYLPEKWVIEQITKAGFKLESKSEINANAKDTKDHAEGVWALPPNLRVPDAEKAKFQAIGESDRMTLKFVKPKK